MPGHPISSDSFPDINPTGAPSGDFLHVEASPDAFGGLIAHSDETLGTGLEKASDEGFQTLDQQGKLDAQTHAAELHSWQSDQTTDAQEKFFSLKGKAALDALPAFKQQLQDYHQQAMSQAGNPATKLLVDENGRRLIDNSYSDAARHAAAERTTWESNTAKNAATSYGDSAVLTALHSPAPNIADDLTVYTKLFKSDQEIRNLAESQGYEGPALEQQVAANRGRNVNEIVKQLTSDGSQTGLQRAIDFLHSQYDKIDPASRVTIEQGPKSQAAKYDGMTAADRYMGRGPSTPPGYIQRTFQIESGGDPNAGQGSYRGLGAFGPQAEARYGIDDSNRTDPNAQARALQLENQDNHDALAHVLGHEPTPADYYLAHQQGIGGAVAHLSEPTLPAWQNMASTQEGRQKGEAWAKQAVWGNMTPEMKAQFPGGVETVTSGDFARMWAQRFNGQQIQASAPGEAYGGARFSGAQSFNVENKADVLARLQSDPYLVDHPQAMSAAIEHVNQIYETQSAAYADQERQLKIQKQQQELVSDDAENGYLRNIYGPNPNANIQGIVNDPRLTREAKTRLIAIAGDPGERDAKTYGSGFEQAFRDVHAPPGDPNRITSPDQLYARLGSGVEAGRQLNMAGVEKLRQELDLKKTPEGEAESEMKRQFLVNAKAQITGTDEGLHLKDPKGDELYLKFMAQFLPAYDKARRDGMAPAQLLDPSSKDYLGNLITGFKRPADQWFNDTIHDNSAVTAQASFDPKSVKSVEDLVAAYRAGKVSKAVADQTAIANGWASRKPVAPQVPISQ